MTQHLTPQVLDIVITKVTDKTVYYKLSANQREEKWRIPACSTFNKSQLLVGQRYRVISQVVSVLARDYIQRKKVKQQRFDWINVTEITPKTTLQARSAKQREASDDLATKPFVDDGTIFKW